MPFVLGFLTQRIMCEVKSQMCWIQQYCQEEILWRPGGFFFWVGRLSLFVYGWKHLAGCDYVGSSQTADT